VGQPGQLGGQFSGDDAIIRRLQDLERTVRELAAANILATAGINAVPNGIIVQGSETVNGPLITNGALTINGAATITGTLSLPAGIIDNDALASPVRVGRASNGQTGYGLTTTDQTFASTTIAVPAGFSQALVFLVCTVGAINPNATDDFLYSSAVINGSASREVFGYVAANSGSVAVTTAKSDILTGLSGGNITVAVNVHAQDESWSAHASNRAYVEAQAIFLR